MNKGQFAKGYSNPNKILPVIGTKFGSLEVISSEERYRSDGKTIWQLRCSCSREQWITSKDLRRSKNPRVVCSKCSRSLAGKLRMEKLGSTKLKGSHSGVGDFTLTHLQNFKCNAVKRGIEWNLDANYLWNIYLKHNKKCALSGMPIEFGELVNSRPDYNVMTASLDRIDSNQPYVEGNVQWVHKHINIMKNKYDEKYFIEMCKAVAKYDNHELSLGRNILESATTRERD
jgi:hypothetical protein